jgi:hypothetical protein
VLEDLLGGDGIGGIGDGHRVGRHSAATSFSGSTRYGAVGLAFLPALRDDRSDHVELHGADGEGSSTALEPGRQELAGQHQLRRREERGDAAPLVDQLDDVAASQQPLPQGAGHRHDPCLGRRAARPDRLHVRQLGFDQRFEEGVAISDVPVDGGDRHTELGGKLPHGESGYTS